MKEQITDFVETRVENYEEELDQPLGERLMKTVIVGTVGVLATAVAGALYDAAKNRPKALAPAPEEQEEQEGN